MVQPKKNLCDINLSFSKCNQSFVSERGKISQIKKIEVITFLVINSKFKFAKRNIF